MTRNSRNLRKFALDMWSNAGVARGLFAEPHITRREAAQAWGPGAPRPNDQVEAIAAALFDTAAVLHGEMLPPLQKIQAPMQAEVVLPPSLATRRIVLVPSNRPGASLSISHPSSILFTPEALHLYIRFTNPFLFDLLPPHFFDLGFQRPPVSSYQFAINRWRCGILARKPGFGQAGLGVGPRTIVYANYAAACLAESRYPLSITAQQLGPLAAGQHAVDDYFRNHYAEAYSLCR